MFTIYMNNFIWMLAKLVIITFLRICKTVKHNFTTPINFCLTQTKRKRPIMTTNVSNGQFSIHPAQSGPMMVPTPPTARRTPCVKPTKKQTENPHEGSYLVKRQQALLRGIASPRETKVCLLFAISVIKHE